MQRNSVKVIDEIKMDVSDDKVSSEKFKLFGDEKARLNYLLQKEFNYKNDNLDNVKDYYNNLINERKNIIADAVAFELFDKDRKLENISQLIKEKIFSLDKLNDVAKKNGVNESEIEKYTQLYNETIDHMLHADEFVKSDLNKLALISHIDADLPEFKDVPKFKDAQQSLKRFIWIFIAIIHSGSENFLKLLLERKPDIVNIELSDYYNVSLLNNAIVQLNLPMVKCILEKKPNNINLTNSLAIWNNGIEKPSLHFGTQVSTPLYLALLETFGTKNIEAGKEIIKLLLQSGAKPNVACSDLEDIGPDSPFYFCQRNYNKPDINDAMREVFDIIIKWDPSLKLTSEEIESHRTSDPIREMLGFRI